MPTLHLDDPSLTIAIALAAGMVAQSLARHLRIPGIVLLLGAGLVLGPDVLGIVRPQILGDTLQSLVGFAVAVILFEGGMNLNLSRMRREAHSIPRLVTVGAATTAVGGALAARWILGWPWIPAALFGTLVIVTGPTVINPLLRRIRVQPKVATVLEAEGVLGDAVGAITAVVALEVVLELAGRDPGISLALGAWGIVVRLGTGLLLGALGGGIIAALLRLRHVVPDGLENVFTLSLALVLFHASNSLYHESGIAAVTAAGMVVGNVRTRALPELREFKEQLTVLLIGMLFVLLAADIRVQEVRDLGTAGLLTVAALMFVVRPLNVMLSTWGSDLSARERGFIAWLAPRGIVAAAVSSLFAQTLDGAGVEGGTELRALVFLVIAVTVTVQGLTGGVVARLLGVARGANQGFLILGAGDLGRALARAFVSANESVVLVDTSQFACRAAQNEGLRVLHGSGLDERIMLLAGADSRAGCIAITPNEEVNLLFVQNAMEEYGIAHAWVALRKGHQSVRPEMVDEAGARLLFGAPRSIDFWTLRLERGTARVESWVYEHPNAELDTTPAGLAESSELQVLPIAVRRKDRVRPVDDRTEFKKEDVLIAVVFQEHRDQACAWFETHGWAPAEAGAEPGEAGVDQVSSS
jgi:NhaP-type Na+/H+ or K+/H+ antiporter